MVEVLLVVCAVAVLTGGLRRIEDFVPGCSCAYLTSPDDGIQTLLALDGNLMALSI
jgi:hypothetical protein